MEYRFPPYIRCESCGCYHGYGELLGERKNTCTEVLNVFIENTMQDV